MLEQEDYYLRLDTLPPLAAGAIWFALSLQKAGSKNGTVVS